MPINTSVLKVYNSETNQYEEVPAIKGSSGVYIGTVEPTDNDVNVWVDLTSSEEDVGLKVSDLYTKTFSQLNTTNKTIIGAINELLAAK